MTKIKLCGLFQKADIVYANQAQPDFVGFVFVKTSRRYVSFQQAVTLRKKLDWCIPVVGVFVNEPLINIQKAFKAGIIQYAQLQGQESEKFVNQLQTNGIPVIRAVSAGQLPFKSQAEYLLIDGPKAGSGQTFSWSTVVRPDQAFFLAGGITLTNVLQAIKELSPNVIDVSSGIETRGVKDRQKMISIVRKVHYAKNN